MYCQKCGLEVSAGANFCIACGSPVAPAPPLAPPTSGNSSKVPCVIVAIMASVVGLFFFGVIAAIAIPNFILAQNKSRFTACLQSMNTLSNGLQDYLSEKGNFDGLPQSDGNGEEICNHIFPGYDKMEYCAGKVRHTMTQNCLDYQIDVNTPTPFQYEITGHSKEKLQCGICVTEDGYCPTKYSGLEPPNSRCIQSCKVAGLNSTAVCPH